jgi:hypothetical protein
MKVNNYLRDKILQNIDTLAINDHTAYLYGIKFTYNPLTKKEVNNKIDKIRDLLKPYIN